MVTEENAENFIANMSIAPPPPGISELDKFEKSGALKDTTDSQTHACPKTYRDIHKMKPAQQEAWFKSNDKEFETLIKKGALRIIDTRHIPRDAIFVPTKYAFRVKACGTLKSRLCVLGNLMPKDDMDLTCPTPRLSTVRLLRGRCELRPGAN